MGRQSEKYLEQEITNLEDLQHVVKYFQKVLECKQARNQNKHLAVQKKQLAPPNTNKKKGSSIRREPRNYK